MATLAWAGCTTSAPVAPITQPGPTIGSAIIRVGLGAEQPTLHLRSEGTLRISSSESGLLTILPAGETLQVEWLRQQVVLRTGPLAGLRTAALLLESDAGAGMLELEGKGYRGMLELRAGKQGIQAINRLPLESYLVGVVSAELGPRDSSLIEAVKAQVVTARTYAIRNRGRWAARGFDLRDDVSDQVYPGILSENRVARAAVAATQGQVLTWEGQVIEVFYSSSCGGHTAAVEEAFNTPPRPWLRGVPDLAPDGTPWCAGSPHSRWEEAWSGAGLARVLSSSLAAAGLAADRATDLSEVRILERSSSGRALAVELVGKGGRTILRGAAVRRVLEPERGGLLRSSRIEIRLRQTGGRLTALEITGQGNGHGVGLCQWGALGRARAGQDYRTILTSYFPGVAITRISEGVTAAWQSR